MYHFVHPTKTGGTTVEQFLSTCDSGVVHSGRGHDIRCEDVDKSIVLIRDPYIRAESVFRYWKFGSREFCQDRLHQRSHIDSATAFWKIIESHCVDGPSSLVTTRNKSPHNTSVFCGIECPWYMWEAHFLPMTWWIGNGSRKDTRILVNNETHLKEHTFHLLDSIGCPYDPASWETQNVTLRRVPETGTVRERCPILQGIVRRLFEDDCVLWDTYKDKMSSLECLHT